MMNALGNIFTQMKAELDQGITLNVTMWHGKAHDATSDWWTRFITRYERRMGKNHALSRTLPEGIVDEVCELFERMEEEYRNGSKIILNKWQEEYKTYVERWWEGKGSNLQLG